jgi:hypothetical protein
MRMSAPLVRDEVGAKGRSMTAGHSEHKVAVAAWLQRAARGSRVEIIEAFEHAFTALWRRSLLTLGGVTLTAIVERVLYSASEQYPALAGIVVGESAIRWDGLRSAAAGLHEDQARAALQFVLVEFLTVQGNLTAEILTPALHDELSKCHSRAKGSGITEDKAR